MIGLGDVELADMQEEWPSVWEDSGIKKENNSDGRDAKPEDAGDAIRHEASVKPLGRRGKRDSQDWKEQEPHSMLAEKHRQRAPAHCKRIGIPKHL